MHGCQGEQAYMHALYICARHRGAKLSIANTSHALSDMRAYSEAYTASCRTFTVVRSLCWQFPLLRNHLIYHMVNGVMLLQRHEQDTCWL